LILMQLRPLREIDFISAQNGLVLIVNFCKNSITKKWAMYMQCLVCARCPFVNTSRARVSFIVLVLGGE
jgi:hypothetical protein